MAAWDVTSGPLRFAVVVIVPLAAAVAWVVFNVIGDPSRSGAAPIEVPGWTRLAIELAILAAGAVAFAIAGRLVVALVDAALIVFHYALSWPRIRWLLQR